MNQSQTNWNGTAGSFLRGLALSLGVFTLVNLLGQWRAPLLDANLWWIDWRWLPAPLAGAISAAGAVALVGFGLHAPAGRTARLVVALVVWLLALGAVVNATAFWVLLARGVVRSWLPVPFSALVAIALALIGRSAWLGGASVVNSSGRNPRLPLSFLAGTLLLALLPAAQMVFFGNTDYRRPADVAVVLGARAYADGRPSEALSDRVQAACRLYAEGRVGKLLISGGPGDGVVSEAESGRRLAIRLGVPAGDILCDDQGLNTAATVANTTRLCREQGLLRVLVVSHFYHLPRIKLAYQRAGWEVYTVPAPQQRWLARLPWFMAREVPAVWVYYFRALCAGAPRESTASA